MKAFLALALPCPKPYINLEITLNKSFFRPPFTPIVALICLLTIVVSTTAQTTVNYTSPIADYKPFTDETVVSWKAANDNVGQIGGWRVYAKEAQQTEDTPVKTPSASSNKADTTKTNPHAGHHK